MTTQTEAEAHAAQHIEAQMRVALEAAKPKLWLCHGNGSASRFTG
jgi:hypothetical protein